MSGLLPFARTRGNGAEVAVGNRIGRLFSDVRTLGTDMMLSSEKSYRGTLLGIHHGILTFLLLEDAATAADDQDLADFCASWLGARTKLIADAERDLAWFAANPERAMARALPPFVKRLQRAVPLPEVLRERAGGAA